MYFTLLYSFAALAAQAYQSLGIYLPWEICLAIAQQWLQPIYDALLIAGLL